MCFFPLLATLSVMVLVFVSGQQDANNSSLVGGSSIDRILTDEIRTENSQNFQISKNGKNGPERIPMCSEENRKLVKKCFEHYESWITMLGKVDINQSPFENLTQATIFNASCEAFQSFKSCLGNLFNNPGSCIVPEALDTRTSYATYTCDKLLPEILNQSNCFDRIVNHICFLEHPIIYTTMKISNFCRPVLSMKKVVNCALYVEDFCLEDEKDKIQELRTDNGIWDIHYDCSDSTIERKASCPSYEELDECKNHLADLNLDKSSRLLGISPSELFSSCKGFRNYKKCLQEKEGMDDPFCWPTDEDYLYFNSVFSIYCTSDVMEKIVRSSECLNQLTGSLDLFPCQISTGSDTGNGHCVVLKKLYNYIQCGHDIVEQTCEDEAYGFINDILDKLADKQIDMNCW